VIDLYTWQTPNGFKISILLEELGWDYKVHEVNIGKDEQFEPAFLKLCPNNKIPAITDSDGPDGAPLALFESGAILIYLANKAGRFISPEPRQHIKEIQWLMFQMAHVGPMLGQTHHFRAKLEPEISYARTRYLRETQRLYAVMNGRLADSEYLAGPDYSVADIATWPWISRFEWHEIEWPDYPHLKRWFDAIWARPAVKRGRAVPRVGAIWSGAFADQAEA
jgi:GST-like protein